MVSGNNQDSEGPRAAEGMGSNIEPLPGRCALCRWLAAAAAAGKIGTINSFEACRDPIVCR